MKPIRTLLALALLTIAAHAQSLTANFPGEWTGTLEYRDFQTDAQTFLPTWLTISATPGTDTITLDYTYDDGPTKVVHERSIFTFTATSLTIASDRDHTADTYALTGIDDFRKLNRGTLTATGKGIENDKPVDVRITLTLRRNLYSFRKETRAAGTREPFRFRDAYTFTRAKPPAL